MLALVCESVMYQQEGFPVPKAQMIDPTVTTMVPTAQGVMYYYQA